ncbi:S41 family peptidase [Mucilaginibacter rigui]|uniref:S41 family peptidase n=1 Tax=Mucilaginibacter rigui TaxID=534635 RepID=A0ABR7X5P8_9SPHI|nr:S41 family peptidase [Mucilaginibacter rigui]MBD1385902.1 S41 family peptidase [Mucilaginibacter rigui]
MKTTTAILIFIMSYFAVAAQTGQLTNVGKAEVVNSIAKNLEAKYINLDTAKKMGRYIERELLHGAYDTITSPQVFAARLTNDLLSVYYDGHLSIAYNPAFATSTGQVDTAAEHKRFRHMQKIHNFGFDKAEMLPGNIGYLKIGGFFAPDQAGKAMVQAAFRFVSSADVLIIDLRENHGGDPSMVSYMCGFLFANKVHLNDLYTRSSHSLDTFWAVPDTELTALQTVPVYVLTSKQTFSAGEEFSYDLKTQKRAMIIGEATGGGAHPVQSFPVANGFVANIPFARAVNPVTKTDWEGIGVQPDVVAPADQALDVALKMAAAGK